MGHLLSGFLIGLAVATSAEAAPVTAPSYSYFAVGDVHARRPARTEPALLLSGGGDWDLDAFRWFAAKAGHGHIVMLGAYGGGEDGAEFFHDVGGVASVETLVFNSRAPSFDPRVLAVIRHADGIFIEGGDQSKYVRFWKDTPVAKAIDEAVRHGKPVGGTSAGLAVLGGAAYGAMDGGSVDSATALRDPRGPAVTIVHGFLHMPFLEHVITDTHFTARNRLGRLIAFLAQEKTVPGGARIGLGVDQESALCVDANGLGKLFTTKSGFAWLLQPESPRAAPAIRAGVPLDHFVVDITGVGPASTIDLKSMAVANPAFRKAMAVQQGALRDLQAPH